MKTVYDIKENALTVLKARCRRDFTKCARHVISGDSPEDLVLADMYLAAAELVGNLTLSEKGELVMPPAKSEPNRLKAS